MALEHQTGKERERHDTHTRTRTHMNTHTHTQERTPFLDFARLVAGSHYLELWDEAGMAAVRCVCVCMCVRGVSVKGCQCVEMRGEVVPNESPRSEGLSLTAANFT